KDYFMINGESVKPEVPQQIIDGNFYFPLRAVGDYIGADTWWDNSTKTAHIIYNEKHSYVICKAEEAVSEQILNVDLYEEAYKSDMNMLTELINENFNALKWNDYDKSYVVAASLVRYCELDIYGTLEDAQAIGIFKDILSLNPDSIYVYRVDEENFDNAAKTVFNISKGELRTSIGKGGLVYKDGYYYIVSGWFEVHDSPDFYIESYDKLSDGTYLIIFAPNTKENKNFNMDKLDCIAGLRTINGKKVWRIYSFGNFYFS
ncbi:MAG: hypothetical protein IJ736_00635, partial [Firmicutes bacterium]|nr:hypothetical protein [Bacillota bacterium]